VHKNSITKSIAIHRMQITNERLLRRFIPAQTERDAFKESLKEIGQVLSSSSNRMVTQHLSVGALVGSRIGFAASSKVARGSPAGAATA
jgi:hypothetical protein